MALQESSSKHAYIITFSIFYLTAISIIYLYCYWSTFDINIANFLTISDIILYSSFNTIDVLLYSVIASLFLFFFFKQNSKDHPTTFDCSTLADKNDIIILNNILAMRLKRLKQENILFIIFIFFTIVISICLFFVSIHWWAFVLVPCLCFVMFYGYRIVKLIECKPENARIIATIVYFLLLTPCYSIWKSKENALNILHKYRYLNATIALKNKISFLDENNTARLLGYAGDYVFFLDSHDKTIIINKNEILYISYKQTTISNNYVPLKNIMSAYIWIKKTTSSSNHNATNNTNKENNRNAT